MRRKHDPYELGFRFWGFIFLVYVILIFISLYVMFTYAF